MDEIEKDKRFSHITKDVRFKKIPRKEKKVKIDKRFQSMFTDERFQLKSVVDKRGRPYVAKGSEHLQRYYDYSESEDSHGEPDEDARSKHDDESENSNLDSETKPNKQKRNKETDESKVPESVISSTKLSRKELAPDVKEKLRDLVVDYARGEGTILSESSSDEESSSEDEEEELDHDWGEMDREASTTDESSQRLALCNMDWDRITAQDIMVLIHSFLPPGGVLRTVTIYPSEFGLKRIQEEEEKGPTELTAMPETEEKDDDELSIEQREKLREYQLKRLKYFYAVLVFDSVRTADHVYKECDGLEYESSMNRLDLRFVPDDTEFDQEPKEECRELPDLSSYKPRLYRTTALTQVKVDLTWDETDPARQEMIMAAHQGKFDDSNLDKFLASSSDEEDEPEATVSEGTSEGPISEKKAIEKYKALLAGLTETEEKKVKDDVAMEVTWDLKLEQKTSEKLKEAGKSTDAVTPFEKFMEKKKQKKKSKKQTKKGNDEDESGDDQPFSDDDIPSDIDMNDPYFKQELDQMGGCKKGKTKKKPKNSEDDPETEQKKAELELLMLDSVKEEPKQHFSLKKIEEKETKSKKKKSRKKKANTAPQVEDTFKMNVDDDRFSAIYSSHLYNVDPATPNYKPTEGMKALIEAKLKRKRSDEPAMRQDMVMTEKKKKDAELNLLVKSVKRKAEAAKQKNKPK